MMKKILFAFAMLAMVAGFTSCGDGNNGNNKGEDMTTTQFLAMSAKTRINSVLIYDCDFTAKIHRKICRQNRDSRAQQCEIR